MACIIRHFVEPVKREGFNEMSLTFGLNLRQNVMVMTSLRTMRADFGKRLRYARRAAGFETARELAIAIDIEESVLSHYELGKRRPPNDVLLKIRTRLRVTTDYLYFGDTSGLSVALEARLRELPGHDRLVERR